MVMWLESATSEQQDVLTLGAVRRWLWVAILALAMSGVYSIIIVLARTPKITSILPFKEVFHTSLIVHVDLLVVGWFFGCANMFWSMLGGERVPFLENLLRNIFVAGLLLLAYAPFSHAPQPYLNNYIPVLDSPLFISAIRLLLVSSCVHAVWTVIRSVPTITREWLRTSAGIWSLGVFISAFIYVVACIALVASYVLLQGEGIIGQVYFEHLFWAGGHIVQFTHTELMLVSWLVLLSACGVTLPKTKPVLLVMLMMVGLLAVLGTPMAFMQYKIYDYEFTDFFTKHMIHAGGTAAMLLAPWTLWAILSCVKKLWAERPALVSALMMSILLFGVGGVFGMLIDGPNVRIPAHYHGSIIGVSLAFMGVMFVLLPTLGYADVSRWKLAIWQPMLYGFGQLLHISGLFFSGGYEVLRKTPGEVPGGEMGAKVFMGIMGLGGLLAIIGGVLFLIVVWKARKQVKN